MSRVNGKGRAAFVIAHRHPRPTVGDMKTLLLTVAMALLSVCGVSAADAPDQGPVVGVGAMIKSVDHHPVIDQLVPGNPAAKSGLKPGDRIVKIDGTSTNGLELGKVAELLRGAAGTHVKVTVLRGTETRTFTVKRQIVMLDAPGNGPSTP